MTAVRVDLETLDELVRRMSAFGARAEVVRADVDARLRRVQAVWDGAAAVEQAAAHARWAAGATEMAQGLATMRSIASTAHENYLAAVRANAAMWS